ncbi:MAG: FAD-binding oxidoreductase [Planctomycetales bacterium]|nr:FAD-binding oxidoreductase [Planctomycetales bacterium]
MIPKTQTARCDVVVVGGGILGLCVADLMTQRGRLVTLVERSTLATAASGNTLRIVHGGFRYLQSLDISRLRESRREQNWFLDRFNESIRPIPCVLPLDGRRLRVPLIARWAARLNSVLARRLSDEKRVPSPSVMSRSEIASEFGLEISPSHGLVWYDAVIADYQQIIADLASAIRNRGGDILEHTQLIGLATPRSAATSNVNACLECKDADSITIECEDVIICVGADNAEAARNCGFDLRRDSPITAFNVVFNVAPQMRCAFAIPTERQTYFAVPRGDRVVIGTSYLHSGEEPTTADIQEVCRELQEVSNVADVPWQLTVDNVCDVDWARIAADGKSPAKSSRIIQQRVGPRGRVTFAITPKFTVARSVAQRIVDQVESQRSAKCSSSMAVR